MFVFRRVLLLLAFLVVTTTLATPTNTTAVTTTETTQSSPIPMESTTNTVDHTTDCAEQPNEIMQVQIMATDKTASDELYHYICYAGISKTENLMCSAGDALQYTTAHDVEVNLRCPGAGAGRNIAYIEIQTWLTSRQLYCRIIEGGIGRGYVGILVTAMNTLSLRYESLVYSV